jgi:hypothetical protein
VTAWREQDHPRDERGRWAEKVSARLPGAPRPEVDVWDEAKAEKWVGRFDATSAQGDAWTRRHYIQRALRDKLDMSDEVTLLVVTNDRGRPVGAASVRDQPGKNRTVILNAGAIEGTGAGTKLVQAAIRLTLERNRRVLYAEPTMNAQPFWEGKMGFREDPLGVGTYYFGLTRREMGRRVDGR